MDFSSVLIRIRAELDYSQQQLAESIGVAFATVNRWENSKTTPSKKHIFIIKELCKKNGIEIEEVEHE